MIDAHASSVKCVSMAVRWVCQPGHTFRLGKKSGHLPIPCVSGENPEPATGLGATELVPRELGWHYDDPHEQPGGKQGGKQGHFPICQAMSRQASDRRLLTLLRLG
jgi:hypothetical protein